MVGAQQAVRSRIQGEPRDYSHTPLSARPHVRDYLATEPLCSALAASFCRCDARGLRFLQWSSRKPLQHRPGVYTWPVISSTRLQSFRPPVRRSLLSPLHWHQHRDSRSRPTLAAHVALPANSASRLLPVSWAASSAIASLRSSGRHHNARVTLLERRICILGRGNVFGT